VAWIAIVCVLFLLPVSPKGVPGAADFDWNVVNYAPLTVGAALIGFGGWYLISARHWFTGPVRESDIVDSADTAVQDRAAARRTSPTGADEPSTTLKLEGTRS
jgi:hypothetical protein